MMNKKWIGIGVAALATISLAACGNKAAKSTSSVRPAMVTDTGGVNDKSFNQSAWEGMSKWGRENGLKEKTDYTYYESDDESQFGTNLQAAYDAGYNLIFGVGSLQDSALAEAADEHPDTQYVIIDSIIKKDNVYSATFADNEAAYLAGIAAAKGTKTNKVGFIGGMKSDVITRFETGFKAGVKSVNPNITVEVQYADSFADAAKGKTIASTMYASGVDIIYQAAGGVGNGVFQEANAINAKLNADSDEKVWVIGVDRNQKNEGNYTSKDGKESTSTLTSTIKQVGKVVEEICENQKEGKAFPGGQSKIYGLKDNGVSLVTDGLNDETKRAVDAAKEQIIKGEITVPDGITTKAS